MNAITTYTVTATTSKIVWVFKYHLNGILAQFNPLEGELSDKQLHWLFRYGKFPYYEKDIKGWKVIKNFKIDIG